MKDRLLYRPRVIGVRGGDQDVVFFLKNRERAWIK